MGINNQSALMGYTIDLERRNKKPRGDLRFVRKILDTLVILTFMISVFNAFIPNYHASLTDSKFEFAGLSFYLSVVKPEKVASGSIVYRYQHELL